MKYVLIIIAVVIFTTNLYGADSNFVINKAYTGFLMIGANDIGKSNMSTQIAGTSRIGLDGIWQNGIADLKWYFVNDNMDIAQTGGSIYFQKKMGSFSLGAGKITRPMTLMRPHPVSPSGQFEPGAIAQMPVGANGIRLDLNGLFSEHGALRAGVFQDTKDGVSVVEYGLGFCESLAGLQLETAMRSSNFNESFAVALTHEYAKLAYFRNMEDTQSLFALVNIKDYGSVYTDAVHDWKTDKLSKLEFGFTKRLKTNLLGEDFGVILGCGYRKFPVEQFRVYIFVNKMFGGV